MRSTRVTRSVRRGERSVHDAFVPSSDHHTNKLLYINAHMMHSTRKSTTGIICSFSVLIVLAFEIILIRLVVFIEAPLVQRSSQFRSACEFSSMFQILRKHSHNCANSTPSQRSCKSKNLQYRNATSATDVLLRPKREEALPRRFP